MNSPDKEYIIGAEMADSSVYAGLTSDNKQHIFAMQTDFQFGSSYRLRLIFAEVAAAVQEMNNNKMLGHNDWRIPDFDSLKIIYQNRDQGKLKDSFNIGAKGQGFDFPGQYWSDTMRDAGSNFVRSIRFSDGSILWADKTKFRLSCRFVRYQPVNS